MLAFLTNFLGVLAEKLIAAGVAAIQAYQTKQQEIRLAELQAQHASITEAAKVEAELRAKVLVPVTNAGDVLVSFSQYKTAKAALLVMLAVCLLGCCPARSGKVVEIYPQLPVTELIAQRKALPVAELVTASTTSPAVLIYLHQLEVTIDGYNAAAYAHNREVGRPDLSPTPPPTIVGQ